MMKRTLVVYFSRGGSTRRLARQIADQLGAELEEIQESSSRIGAAGYARSAMEALCKGLPSIQTRRDPRDYDRVVIGTPTWAGTMSSPVRSYLFMHRDRLPKVAFFATMGGRGAEGVLREMKLMCSSEDAPSFFATQAEVERDAVRGKIDDFVREVNAGNAGVRPSAAA